MSFSVLQPDSRDDHDALAALERGLHERFTLREETFEHAGHMLCLLMPRAADELLDEAAFERDERMPYWAELWPSARALTRFLIDRPPVPESRIIELGAGLALPSIVLRRLGFDPLATDHNEDALPFVALNAARNGVPGVRTALFDWRDPEPRLGRFDLILAADVLYEARNINMLANCLPRLIAPGGVFLLADPGRHHLPVFLDRLRADGWRESESIVIEETQRLSTGDTVSRVRVTGLTASE